MESNCIEWRFFGIDDLFGHASQIITHVKDSGHCSHVLRGFMQGSNLCSTNG